MISRRRLLAAALLSGAASPNAVAAGDEREAARQARFVALERRHGGRLGVAILDTADMAVSAYRGDERFPLCSTHKLLSAALVLARVDRGDENLGRRVVYARDRLVAYSPVTEKHLGGAGLTVGEICEAALTLSDNTAANLLLDSFGGPAAVTAFMRALGDEVTRLDRSEPTLNDVAAGDPRDTTSPVAMAQTARKLVLGDALSAASREQLAAWLVACKTGDKRLRAGMPKEWRLGDKTGSGPRRETNDVAVIWPPARPPLVVAAYYAGADASDAERDAVLAEIGRVAAD